MVLAFIPFRFPGVPGVRCAFLTRNSGNISLDLAPDNAQATRSRRRSLAARLGFAAFAEARQVHGTVTLFDPQPQNPDEAATCEADGLATCQPDLALMIKTADCQPILLAHAEGKHIAALHAGWRGNRAAYPTLAVTEFCDRYRVRPADLFAVRGPSLGPTAAEFIHFEREWGQDFAPWFDRARQTMDLWRLTRSQLESAGMRPERIFGLDLCTWSLPETFFSYRRFRSGDPRPDGRQASLIWREEG